MNCLALQLRQRLIIVTVSGKPLVVKRVAVSVSD